VFKERSRGIYKPVSHPLFGRQDQGVSPGGAMDRFSFESGYILLGNTAGSSSLELIYPPPFLVEKDCFFIVTGGRFKTMTLTNDGISRNVPHAEVVRAQAGWTLNFGPRECGFRSYLCAVSAVSAPSSVMEGLGRGPFSKISSWRDRQEKIRILPGPEYSCLRNPEVFRNEGWTITRDTSDMGMRLSSGTNSLILDMKENMISEAVSDGTVQLTPKGPIILLRHRQTIGGYPRIFNVINADVDLLAQYAPGQVLHFREVTMNEAREASRMKLAELKKLKQKCSKALIGE